MEPKELYKAEGSLITKFFMQNSIRAKVDWKNSFIVRTGYFRYGLLLDPRERFSAIEGSLRELQTILANNRLALGVKTVRGNKVIPFSMLPSTYPTMALETPHPAPVALVANTSLLFDGQPHTFSLGRSYLAGPQEEVGNLTESPHFLVCGITSAGKSKLLQNILLSLTARTSPQELKLCLIDLKNEDLLPLTKLPHTLQFAGNEEQALEVLRYVEDEKNRRVADPNRKPYRLLVVVDEMASIAGNRDTHEILGKLASIGRSKWINLIGATQHPTKEGGMGALLKANFTTRCVGQVAPGQSQYATNRPGTHAELLPGYGSFLRCEGPAVYRFQGYYMEDSLVPQMVKRIAMMHAVNAGEHRNLPVVPSYVPVMQPVMQPVMDGYATVAQPVMDSYSGTPTPTDMTRMSATVAKKNLFPLDRGRSLTEEEAEQLRYLVREGKLDYQGKPSITAMCHTVYGSKDTKRINWIKEALG